MPQRVHAIIPWQETVILPDFYKLHRTEVRLDPEHAHWMSGKRGSRQLLLSRSQLDMLAEAAGITTIQSEPDHDFDNDIYTHRYVGEYEGSGGRTIRLDRHYTLDMRTMDRQGVDGGYILFARSQAKTRAEKIRKWPKDNWKQGMPTLDPYDEDEWEKWIEARAMADWTMTFRHVTAKAETGAQLRAIRQACNVRGTYHEDEFSMPWAVYRMEFDIQRALLAGGTIGEMAQVQLGAAMTKMLGLPESLASQIVESVGTERTQALPEPSRDLLQASQGEIDQLEEIMKEAGFKDRGQMDRRAMDIFGVSLSQLTVRHVSIMKEAAALAKTAKENIDPEEMPKFSDHLNRIMQVCYTLGATIEAEIEQQWWDRAHGIVEHDNGVVEIEPVDEGHAKFMESVPVAAVGEPV